MLPFPRFRLYAGDSTLQKRAVVGESTESVEKRSTAEDARTESQRLELRSRHCPGHITTGSKSLGSSRLSLYKGERMPLAEDIFRKLQHP